MGAGISYSQAVEWAALQEKNKTEKVIESLKNHVNYEKPTPLVGESKTRFILRSIAHLVSPPQEPEESTTIECVDLAKAIKGMEEELEQIWENHRKN